MVAFVVSKNGERLMPTTRLGRVRHLIKDGKAIIVKRKPFTIQLMYETTTYVQDMELCIDTGYEHIGVSLKTAKKELVSEERELLKDEKQRHDEQRRMRRTRRNRLRYRKPRFQNRGRNEGWVAPSIRNKRDRHIDLIRGIVAVAPVTDIYLEVGQFDTHVLAAVQEGRPIPQGVEYQYGPLYGKDTLREAVFERDGFRCRVCGRGIKENAILHEHHMLFWKNRHANRMAELITVCEKCHTSRNHQPGGKLWGLDMQLPNTTAAAFMNIVRWQIYETVKSLPCNVHLTYGVITKRSRLDLCLEKTHANDAYAMGQFRPTVRAETCCYRKLRRNNRCLEKFYDAVYIDIRDGSRKKGAQLGCERTNRREPRNSEKSLRAYRGTKVSKGRRNIRRRRYDIRPGDKVRFEGKVYVAGGAHSNGTHVMLRGDTKPSRNIKNINLIGHVGAWQKIS